MHTRHHDEPFISWARQRGFPYYYAQEPDQPESLLKLHMGVITAYLRQGKLIQVQAHSAGQLLDQMMFELAQLFAMCAKHDAYMEQAACPPRIIQPSPN
ncbi:MAG: hypothetical protein HJJLKODD_02752 [Phycisphaerae bacterium]|nr:hypothetical protein [Phycisphaerae bacterium]